jgi:hypothetical protein
MKNVWRRESLMKSVLLLFAMTMMAIAGSAVAQAPTATADSQTPFQFELAQAFGPRGRGVEGYVHNGLAWRITNIRFRVDTVGASGTVTAPAEGWVLGDVKAGGRGYFYAPYRRRRARIGRPFCRSTRLPSRRPGSRHLD